MTKFWRGLWATLRTRIRPDMAWPHECEWGRPEVDEIARKKMHLKAIRQWFKDEYEYSSGRSRKLSMWWLIYYGENPSLYRGKTK